MGSISARKTYQILGNLENILAVELLCAAQAFDFHRPLRSSQILEACHKLIRQHIAHADADRIFADDIATAKNLIASGRLSQTATEAARRAKLSLQGRYHNSFSLGA